MRKSISLFLLTICVMIVMTACGAGTASKTDNAAPAAATPATTASATPQAATQTEELTIKHQLGETKVKKNPTKVVVFDFGALDSLDKLGIEVAGVAQSSLPEYLAKYKDSKYQNIGTLKEPDFEKISAIKPDLILISGRQQTAYEELSKLAPTIFIGVDTKNYMESFKNNMHILGQIFNKQAAVDAELAKIDQTIADVKTQVAANGKNALVILADQGTISAFGPGSRFGLIHDVLGIPAVDSNLDTATHGQSISFEFIAQKNADYLFVVDRASAVGSGDKNGAKALVENDLIKKSKAFQNNHIVYLDQTVWYLSGGGLESVASMVGEIAKGYK